MNLDIHIIISMNAEDYSRYYLLFIRYSLLGIPYWVFPIGYSLLDIYISWLHICFAVHAYGTTYGTYRTLPGAVAEGMGKNNIFV